MQLRDEQPPCEDEQDEKLINKTGPVIGLTFKSVEVIEN